jgi:proline iminopeptidase
VPEGDFVDGFGDATFALAFARIECHYFTNHIFLDSDSWILDHTDRLADIPTTLIHGRYDVVCPIENAWDLKKKMPHLDLQVMDTSGHSTFEPQIEQALLAAMEKLKTAL